MMSNMNNKLFAKKMGKALEFRDYTTKKLAIEMHVTNSCIEKLRKPERANSLPSRDTLFRLCNILGLSAEYFLNESIPPEEVANFCRPPHRLSITDRKREEIIEKLCAVKAAAIRERCKNLSLDELRVLLRFYMS